MQLMTTCLVLSVVMLYWEKLNSTVVTHVKSYSYRYFINSFIYINKSFTISPEEARSFSNYPFLLDHPDKCAGKDVLLLLLVKSSPDNVERRNAIRSTWGNETYIQNTLGVTVKVLFALGTTGEEATWTSRSGQVLQAQLVHEDQVHGDLIQQDFLDTFHNLTLKLIMQFHWMHNRCAHARFLMTADDDIFVHMPNLVAYLRDMSSGGVTQLWIGKVHRGAPPVRSKSSKYYMSYEMYPWMSYPDYTSGGGYVVSTDVADKIYHATLNLNASLYIDDVFMGICASIVGVTPKEHVFFSGEGKAPYHMCIYNQMMTSHGHVEDIHNMWKAATDPEIKEWTTGLFGKFYCQVVKIALLCKTYVTAYPCKAAFL